MTTILAPTNSPPTPPSAAVGDALPAVTVTSAPQAWNASAVLTLTCVTPPAPAQRSYALLRFSAMSTQTKNIRDRDKRERARREREEKRAAKAAKRARQTS